MSLDAALKDRLDEARRHAKKLLSAPKISLTEKIAVPVNSGVYLFHERLKSGASERLYVGIANKLRKRIHINHVSAKSKPTTSTLRRSLNKVRNIEVGPAMKKWLVVNCTISFIEIEDPDMRKLVEALVVAVLRPSGKILNKP